VKTHSVLAKFFVTSCILLAACCTVASAKSDIGFKGIGPRIGYVDPEGNLDGSVEFGVAFEFGEFVRQLHWDGSVSFWSTGRDYQYYNGNNYRKYNWSLRDLVLRSGVNYHFVEGEWVPYAGGGLGLHFYSWDYSGAPYYNNASDTKLGLYVDGGIEHQFSVNWTGQMQLQFDFAEPDQTALLFNLIYRLK
jgi:hypothetical protein